ALCVNQTDPNVPKCTPMPPLTSLTSNIGALVNRTPLVSSACGAFAPVVVALKGKNHNKPKSFTMKVTAKSSGKPKKDVDKLKIKCTPNPRCVPGSSTTTTTTIPSCTGSNTAGGPAEVDLRVATRSTAPANASTGPAAH